MEQVSVYYDLEEFNQKGKNRFPRDEEAKNLAGRKEVGAGTYLPTMTRDLLFQFDTEQEATEAKERLKAAGFRFVA